MDMRVVVIARAMVRECLRVLLERRGGISVAGELADIASLDPWLADHAADVAIYDPSGTGAPADRFQPSRIPVVISGSAWVADWLRAGAAAVLPPSADVDALHAAVLSAAAGEPPAADNALPVSAVAFESLTERQRRVLLLAAEGRTCREIGEQLGIGVRTVEAHRAAAMARLGVRSFHEVLLRLAAPTLHLEPGTNSSAA